MILGDNVEHDFTKDDESNREDETSAETNGESERFSDIDDGEVITQFLLYLLAVYQNVLLCFLSHI